MKENFKAILEAFEKSGIQVNTAEFSITEYSLNTHLSFKFSNLDEFIEFLNLNAERHADRIEKIKSALAEKSIDPNNVFYVNFYSPKVAEL